MIVRVDRVIESPLEVTRCTGHHKSPMSCKSTLIDPLKSPSKSSSDAMIKTSDLGSLGSW